ncbi:MAG: helix-turn-helix transcriptional regulator [Gemmatimonadetes bacterium]|nr:helix-turn-helix transcriptional regulator [Gemmatimonadota bacterium]
MDEPQVIFDPSGRPAFAVIPWDQYARLQNDEETLLSAEELYDLAKAEGGESFPIEVADRLITGENPVKVYRNYRGITQKELASAANIHSVYLSQIETGKRIGSARTLAALARALHVTVDDLI